MALPTTNQTIPNNVTIAGGLMCNSFNPPAGCITDSAVLAGTNVAAGKLTHRHQPAYTQVSTVTAAVDRKVIHVAKTTGVIISVDVGAVTANVGAATVVFDCLKNGSTILTGTITLANTTTAFTLLAGTLASTTCAAGDVFEAKVVSATAGGGTIALGPFMRLVVEEQGT